jgi:hypothetical protein
MQKGQKTTPEIRARMSAAQKGRTFSAEARAKIGAAHRGNQYHKGHHHSVETRARLSELGKGHRNHWNGGRTVTPSGYVQILSPGHPYADCKGYVMEHRLVMEAHLGRVLLPTEVVHHINGIKDDNRIENLMRFDSNPDHMQWHREHSEERT